MGQRPFLPISLQKIGKQYFIKEQKDMRFGKEWRIIEALMTKIIWHPIIGQLDPTFYIDYYDN